MKFDSSRIVFEGQFLGKSTLSKGLKAPVRMSLLSVNSKPIIYEIGKITTLLTNLQVSPNYATLSMKSLVQNLP